MGNKVNGLRLVCDTRPWLGSSVTNRDQATMRKDIPARHEPTQQISLCCQSGRKNSAGLSKGSLILGSGLPCRCCKAYRGRSSHACPKFVSCPRAACQRNISGGARRCRRTCRRTWEMRQNSQSYHLHPRFMGGSDGK
jgi:hypothetical protein